MVYSFEKVQRFTPYREPKVVEKERGVGYYHLKHSTITAFQSQRFSLTHLAFNAPGRSIRGG